MSVPTYTVTALVGGQDGTFSGDILFKNGNGDYVLNDSANSILDKTHPIQKIVVSSGWIVDGITITYQTVGGSSTILHGSQFTAPKISTVTFGANEVLISVFGRAGFQTYYNRDMINNIGFVIYDKVAETVRVAGPFGDGNNTHQGTPFEVSDVIAFGGFAQDIAELGLGGLVFYKD